MRLLCFRFLECSCLRCWGCLFLLLEILTGQLLLCESGELEGAFVFDARCSKFLRLLLDSLPGLVALEVCLLEPLELVLCIGQGCLTLLVCGGSENLELQEGMGMELNSLICLLYHMPRRLSPLAQNSSLLHLPS